MTTATLNADELVAELLAEEVSVRGGAVGVVVQDVPHLTPTAVLRRLSELAAGGQELRIAYLGADAAAAAATLGLGTDVFSTEVEQAERWRNERGLNATIVVVASGDEARLSSLHDFDIVGPSELKKRLVRRASTQLGETNDVQGRWWETLGGDDRISFRQLLDYYGALAALEPVDAITRASREVHRIGLLPDPALFDNPRDAAIARRLDLNRDLVSRLQTLTEKDRAAIAANIAAERDIDQRASLNRALRLLRQARRGDGGLDELTLADAQALFGIRRTRPAPDPAPTNGTEQPAERPTVRQMGALAADALAAGSSEEVTELEQALDALVERLNELDEPRLRPERLAVELDSGITVQGHARADLVNLVARLVGEDSYGAWIVVEGEDVDEMLRRFHGDQDIQARFTHDEIAGYLANFDHEAAQAIAARFERYNELRREILPFVRTLCAEPLAVAVVPGPRQLLLDYIAAYQALFEQLAQSYEPLFNEFSSEVDGVVARFLSLELIVLGQDDHVSALLAPTHPLYLWHYAEYARIVEEQRDLLSERDRRLVAEAARELPNFLTSLCVPPVAGDQTLTLPYISRIGPLPYFGPAAERAAGDDGLGPISTLIRAFPDVYPPARTGLRVTLVDPPDAGIYLSLLADLHEAGALDGAHLTVLRHPHEKAGTELRLTADDEDRVARIFRSTTAERRFTFEITPLAAGALTPLDPIASHVLVLFDQSPRRQDRIRVIEHPIQPLAMTQRLQYRAQAKTVDLVPAPGGIFASYFGVAERLSRSAPASHFAVHQAEELRQQLSAALETTQWLAVADKRVDRDLSLGELRVATAQEGERDVAVFAASSNPFRRAIRDVARQYNTAITDDQLAELLEELSDLLDAGVLSLRPNVEGRVNWAHVKGLLGLLIAAHWYRQGANDGRERLLLSLDDPIARRWLHLRDDALRADLIGIESGPTFCSVTVFEVKAVDTPQAEYQIENGTISGAAVEQLLSMRALLGQVFTHAEANELITTPARREILREHAFRELTKARYTPEQRRYWVEVLEQLFSGDLESTLHLHLVDVHLGVDAASLGQPRVAQAHQDHTMIPVTVTKLNEAGIDALRQELPPPPEEPPPPSSEEPEPPPSPPPTPEAEPVEPSEPEPVEPPAPPVGPPEPSRNEAEAVRVYLGVAPGAYGKPREIWFDPELPDQPLPNRHISITGETGSGKTQATKSILHELLPRDLPVLILDFKDDYSSESYVDSENLSVFDASFGGLPFNPLVPPIDPRSGRIAPMNHVHQLSEILKRIYRLGDQQTFHLREAIKEVYTIQGIPTEPTVALDSQTYLPFDAVRDVLVRDGNDALLGRLSPIFDLGLFAADSESDALETLLSSPAVIRLSQLPADEVKNAVAEFLLLALYNHLIRRPHESTLRRVLVLDEAWRLVNSPFLEPLMREGRAFGLSVVIATQFPKDLPDAVVGSTNTKLYFSQTQSDQVREIQRTLVGKTSGAEAEHVSSAIRALRPLSCLIQNAQFSPYLRVDVKPYYERARDSSAGPA